MLPKEIMKSACLLCDNSLCFHKVGCIVVRDGTKILTSFNETLPGEIYCQKGVCDRRERELTAGRCPEITCSIHAEASVVGQAAAKGISLKGTEIYVTTFPCPACARLLVKASISKLYYMTDYINDGNASLSLFKSNNIEVIKIAGEEVWGDKWTY